MANITQKCRCHHQKEGHMLIQPSVLEIRSYYVILGGEHSRIVLYGYIWSRVSCSHPPPWDGGGMMPLWWCIYIHTYIPTYLHTYIHTYHYITLHYLTLHYLTLHSIHTYIPLHYITLPYITLPYLTLPYLTFHTYIHTYHYITLPYITLPYLTLHYLTLHSIHTYIIHTYIYRHTHTHTYIHTYQHTYQHTNIPPPQATGGGPTEPYHHHRPQGGGPEEPYHHHRPQGGGPEEPDDTVHPYPLVGGGGGVANAAPYIYIWMCLKMGGTHRCPFNYIIGENDEYGMQWDTHPQKLGMSTSS